MLLGTVNSIGLSSPFKLLCIPCRHDPSIYHCKAAAASNRNVHSRWHWRDPSIQEPYPHNSTGTQPFLCHAMPRDTIAYHTHCTMLYQTVLPDTTRSSPVPVVHTSFSHQAFHLCSIIQSQHKQHTYQRSLGKLHRRQAVTWTGVSCNLELIQADHAKLSTSLGVR